MSVVFSTLQSIDDPHVHIGVKVDFDQSAWSIQVNPGGIPLLGNSGAVAAVIVAGAGVTNLYLNDGATLVAALNLFSNAASMDETGTGTFVSSDPTRSFDFDWSVDRVI
jgi:hypothetical protein